MSALIQLENFAHLNYEGFGKALKKHDKLTRRDCKLPCMRHWVNAQGFANSPVLRRMLGATEEAYSLLVALQPDEAQAHTNADAEDVRQLRELREVKDEVAAAADEGVAGGAARRAPGAGAGQDRKSACRERVSSPV